MIRLGNRVSKLPLDDVEKATVFVNSYLEIAEETNSEYLCEYDVATHKKLLKYTTDKTIAPNLEKEIQEYFQLYRSRLEDNEYKEMLYKSADEKCCWLARKNRNLIFRDCDWEMIYNKIYESEEDFSRYYPMVCVEANTRKLMDIVTAVVLNDELYEYCLWTN